MRRARVRAGSIACDARRRPNLCFSKRCGKTIPFSSTSRRCFPSYPSAFKNGRVSPVTSDSSECGSLLFYAETVDDADAAYHGAHAHAPARAESLEEEEDDDHPNADAHLDGDTRAPTCDDVPPCASSRYPSDAGDRDVDGAMHCFLRACTNRLPDSAAHLPVVFFVKEKRALRRHDTTSNAGDADAGAISAAADDDDDDDMSTTASSPLDISCEALRTLCGGALTNRDEAGYHVSTLEHVLSSVFTPLLDAAVAATEEKRQDVKGGSESPASSSSSSFSSSRVGARAEALAAAVHKFTTRVAYAARTLTGDVRGVSLPALDSTVSVIHAAANASVLAQLTTAAAEWTAVLAAATMRETARNSALVSTGARLV